jgi:hypothetical protein
MSVKTLMGRLAADREAMRLLTVAGILAAGTLAVYAFAFLASLVGP